MRRKLVFLVFLLLLVAAVGWVVGAIRKRSPREGELRVESSVATGVFLDNKHLGRTPLREKVQSGEYTVKLVPESPIAQLASWQGKVSVGPSLLTYVNASLSESEFTSAIDLLWLEKIAGKRPELSVVTNPDGATVLIDDVTKGVTPLSLQDISAGDHSVTVTSPGFLSRTIKVKLSPGYRLIASFKLALGGGVPEATTAATLTPTTTPPAGGSGKTKIPVPEPAKPYVTIKETPTGFLRVRIEPSTSATEAARVKPGEKYSLVNEKSGWYQIMYDEKSTGWISGQYAEKVE